MAMKIEDPVQSNKQKIKIKKIYLKGYSWDNWKDLKLDYILDNCM